MISGFLDTCPVSGMQQTTIHVPACAVEALHHYRAAHGLSRDGAVRRLLAAHVNRQLEVPERDRLTHVSTIMRYPERPIHPRVGPDLRVQLSMRLPSELMSAAKDVGLVLPGQSPHGGNADYRARPLTDSVMTAIAAVETMTDDVLGGLRPCIRHQAAVGLWRLAVAATMTSEEQRVLLDARDGGDDTLLRVVEILRAENSAWHDQLRTRAIRFLTRRFLTAGSDQEGMLYDQRDDLDLQGDGLTWWEIRADFEEFGLTDSRLDGFVPWSLDLDGRGAANLWRIRRKVELEGLSRWLFTARPPGPLTRRVAVPGWQLRVPDGWAAVAADDPRIDDSRELIDSGQVLLLRTSNPDRDLIWPLACADTGLLRPIHGLDTVVAAIETNWAHGRGGAAVTMPPAAIAEVLLLDNGANTEALPVRMPVFIAHRAGLVSDHERDQIVAAARAGTRDRMARFAAALRPQTTSEHVRKLEAAIATDNEGKFFEVARSEKLRATMVDHLSTVVTKPVFPLEVVSLAQAVADGMAEPALEWLTKYFLGGYRAELREDRVRAWQRGMDNNRHRRPFAGTSSRAQRCDTQA